MEYKGYTIIIPTTGGAGAVVLGSGGFRKEFATPKEAEEFIDEQDEETEEEQ